MIQNSDDHLSLDNFKKWMRYQEKMQPTQKNEWHKSFVGLSIESKLTAKRLSMKIKSEEGDVEELSSDFVEHGGIVADVDDRYFLVEVSKGTFYVHRCYVRKARLT